VATAVIRDYGGEGWNNHLDIRGKLLVMIRGVGVTKIKSLDFGPMRIHPGLASWSPLLIQLVRKSEKLNQLARRDHVPIVGVGKKAYHCNVFADFFFWTTFSV